MNASLLLQRNKIIHKADVLISGNTIKFYYCNCITREKIAGLQRTREREDSCCLLRITERAYLSLCGTLFFDKEDHNRFPLVLSFFTSHLFVRININLQTRDVDPSFEPHTSAQHPFYISALSLNTETRRCLWSGIDHKLSLCRTVLKSKRNSLISNQLF